MRDVAPEMVVVEATGGLETALSAALLAADVPVVVINPRQVRDFAKAQEGSQRAIPLTLRFWRISLKRCVPNCVLCQMNKPSSFRLRWPVGSNW